MKETFWKPKKNPYNGLVKSPKNVKKKDMNWVQAKTKYPKLNPFGDADHDGLMNMYDCKPFDKKRKDLAGSPGLSSTPQKAISIMQAQAQIFKTPALPIYQIESPLKPLQRPPLMNPIH